MATVSPARPVSPALLRRSPQAAPLGTRAALRRRGAYSARSMLGGWPARIVLLNVAAVLATAGCGGGGHPSTTTTTATTTTASTGPAPAAVSVRPPAGPVGTSFTLTATHFHPGETLRFEIRMPDGKIFKGPFHTVPAAGTVGAPYKTTAADPPGDYSVRAATDKGTSAQGTFRLTPTTPPPSQGSPTTAGSSSTTTTTRITTTTRSH
jgi:hypothetical protein